MARAIEIYTGGVHNLTEVAVRSDGVAFQRYQERGRFGYQWSAWKVVASIPATVSRATADDANLNKRALFNAKGNIRVRLPE